MNAIKTEYEQTCKIDGETLILLMFDFVKRKLVFDGIILELNQVNPNCKMTKLQMFNYVLLHAQEDLRILLFITCS